MKENKNITALVISTLVSLIAIISFAGAYITKLTTVEVELANVRESLTSIETKLDKKDEKIENLNERLLKVEHKIGVDNDED